MCSKTGELTSSKHPQENRAHFGRKKGHKLRSSMAERFKTLLPGLTIDISSLKSGGLASCFPASIKSVRIEIGFGGAEHLLHQARLYPDVGFIGCEAFEEGVAKALAGIEKNGLDNVRLHFGDAVDLLVPLADLPQNESLQIDKTYLLYPDPWPKRRHWKRRFVNADRVALIASLLRPGGELRFASDISSNITWTLAHIAQNPDLIWNGERAEDWQTPWKDWLSTRYEQKALREGRRPAYFIFQRM